MAATHPRIDDPVVTSLYIGDLESNVTESQLFHMFNEFGEIVSVRVSRDFDFEIGLTLIHGYVNFTHLEDAKRAIMELSFTPLNGKPIRVMYFRRNPIARCTGTKSVFVKNLHKEIDQKALHQTFSTFGDILSWKIATDNDSKVYCLVQYASEESALNAIVELDGAWSNGKRVHVESFLGKQGQGKLINATMMKLPKSTTGCNRALFKPKDKLINNKLSDVVGQIIEGRARLQRQCAKPKTTEMVPNVALRTTMYPPPRPRAMGLQRQWTLSLLETCRKAR